MVRGKWMVIRRIGIGLRDVGVGMRWISIVELINHTLFLHSIFVTPCIDCKYYTELILVIVLLTK